MKRIIYTNDNNVYTISKITKKCLYSYILGDYIITDFNIKNKHIFQISALCGFKQYDNVINTKKILGIDNDRMENYL